MKIIGYSVELIFDSICDGIGKGCLLVGSVLLLVCELVD